jgi:hypothetical protein
MVAAPRIAAELNGMHLFSWAIYCRRSPPLL